MDARRIGLALVVALLISGAFTLFLYTTVQQNRSERPQTTQVVAAKSDLRAGTLLAADNLVLLDWPINVTLTGSFSKIEDIIGRPVIYPVAQNQPIMERDLALAGSGIGLSVRIPEGMRAVAVRSNEIVGVAGFLFPGSHVDVLVTYTPEGRGSPVTQTVLQNVEVLTAGAKIEPDPSGKPETVNVVTLLLNPEDATKLVLAGSQGSIQFVLRNGIDTQAVETRAVSMSELIGGRPVAGPQRAPAPARRVARVPDFYEVETIAAGKRLSEKFEEARTPEE